MPSSVNKSPLNSEELSAVLSGIGVTEKFFIEILNSSDDWAFIIKSHALIEAAVTHLLVTEFERPELIDIFSRIDICNSQTGKIVFAKQLKLLNQRDRKFVRALSELRNLLVHDVKNTNFSFDKCIDQNLKRKADTATKAASEYFKEEIDLSDVKVSREQFAEENPRQVIWFAVFFMLAEAYPHVGPNRRLVKALLRAKENDKS